MKKEVDDAYNAYLKTVPKDQKPKKCIATMTEIMKKHYENAAQDVKDKVEAYRTRQNTEGSQDPTDLAAANREYQECVTSKVLKCY